MQQHGFTGLVADKTRKSPEIDKLMVELGNAARAVPFYAIYPRSGGSAITLLGPITQQQLLDALENAK